jgi:adenylosuccinate lyase
MKVWDEEKDFQTMVKADKEINTELSTAEIERVFSLDHYLRNIDTIFERVFR